MELGLRGGLSAASPARVVTRINSTPLTKSVGAVLHQKGTLMILNEQVPAATYETWLKDTVL